MMYDVNACDIITHFVSMRALGLFNLITLVCVNHQKCMSVLKSRLPSGQDTGGGAGDSAAVLLNRLSSMQQRHAAESYAIISQVCF